MNVDNTNPKRLPDEQTEKAVRSFLRHIQGRYPVKEIFLYGSRARGTHTQDSDADLAIVLEGRSADREAGGRITKEMAGVAFDVLMETDVLVQAMPLWEEDMEYPERFSNPRLIAAIKQDGLLL